MALRQWASAVAAVGFLAAAGAVGAASAGAQVAAAPYANCSAAHADGRFDIPEGDPDYWSGGDRDDDGLACES